MILRRCPIEDRKALLRQGTDTSAAATWQRTLWAMVGIQFVMTAAFSMLSPIMPLLLPVLGVSSAGAVALWAGILDADHVGWNTRLLNQLNEAAASGDLRDAHALEGGF